jgi:hypothetical protein
MPASMTLAIVSGVNSVLLYAITSPSAVLTRSVSV